MNKIFEYVSTILILALIILAICVIVRGNKKEYAKKNNLTKAIFSVVEGAYAEGQADALNGDIRVRKINDSTYVWTKSPWNSGLKPIFDTLTIK